MTDAKTPSVIGQASAFPAADGETLKAMLFEPTTPTREGVLLAAGLGMTQACHARSAAVRTLGEQTGKPQIAWPGRR